MNYFSQRSMFLVSIKVKDEKLVFYRVDLRLVEPLAPLPHYFDGERLELGSMSCIIPCIV